MLSPGYSVSVSIFRGDGALIFYLLQRTGSPISPAFYTMLAALASLTVAEVTWKPLPDTWVPAALS